MTASATASAGRGVPEVLPDPRLVLICGATLYLAAGAAALAVLRPVLGELVDVPTAPQLVAMATGLQRLLIALLFVPPAAALLATASLWGLAGGRRNDRTFLFWLAAAFIPFAVEHAGNAFVVILRERPTNPGEVIALTQAFSFGPRLIAELAGRQLGPALIFWSSAFSFAAVVAIYCWGRAIAVAGTQRRTGLSGRPPDGFEIWVGIACAAGIYLAAVSTVFVLSGPIIRIFLSIVG